MKTNDIPQAHPLLHDALQRQDETARQMTPSEGFTERVMAKTRHNSRCKQGSGFRIAATFLVAAFLGAMAFAAYQALSPAKDNRPTEAIAPSLTGEAEGETVLFDNLRLDSLLSLVAAHYDRTVCFRDTAARALRLTTVWDRTRPLADFLGILNEFDGLQLTDERDTVFVVHRMRE